MGDMFPIDEAREIRAARAAALQSLKRGETTALAALREPQEALGRVDIWTVLTSCHGLGPDGVRTILERAAVWPLTEMRKLTKAERIRLIHNLPPRARQI
jgi:hypothetical protein